MQNFAEPGRNFNLKTRTAVNAKISMFVICVESIIYLLLFNLHDCTSNYFRKSSILDVWMGSKYASESNTPSSLSKFKVFFLNILT